MIFNFVENLQSHSMNKNMKHVFREKILRFFFMKLCTIVNCKKLQNTSLVQTF